MDGKQRLTSILSFFDGQVRRLIICRGSTLKLQADSLYVFNLSFEAWLTCLPDKNAESKRSFYYTLPASHTKKQLGVPEHFKRIFDSKKIRCGK